MGVATAPGEIELTLILSGAPSSAAMWMTNRSADLLFPYAALPEMGLWSGGKPRDSPSPLPKPKEPCFVGPQMRYYVPVGRNHRSVGDTFQSQSC
jgi:hypothetical protein